VVRVRPARKVVRGRSHCLNEGSFPGLSGRRGLKAWIVIMNRTAPVVIVVLAFSLGLGAVASMAQEDRPRYWAVTGIAANDGAPQEAAMERRCARPLREMGTRVQAPLAHPHPIRPRAGNLIPSNDITPAPSAEAI
jgi:hypothetical protein